MDEFAEEEVVENPTLRAAYNLAPLHQNQPLRWDYKVDLIGEKIYDKIIHLCEICELPILVYGRMLPCKHIFCFECARKCDKSCRRCSAKVQKVEKSALGTVFVCTHGAPKHSTKGCRRTYLSQRDLQSHIAHRHLPKASSTSVKAQPAPPAAQPVPNQLPLTQQQAAQQAAQKQLAGAAPTAPHPSPMPSHLQSSPVAGQNSLVTPVSSLSLGHSQSAGGVVSPTPPLIPGLGDLRPVATVPRPLVTVAPPLMGHNSPLVHSAASPSNLPPPQSIAMSYTGTGQANPDIYRPLDMAMGHQQQQHHQHQHHQHHPSVGMTSPHLQANQPHQAYPQSSQSLQSYSQPQQFPVSNPLMQQISSQQMTSTMAGQMNSTMAGQMHATNLPHQHSPLPVSQAMDVYNKPQNIIPPAGQSSQSRTNVNLITVPIQDEGQYRPLPYVNPSMAPQSNTSTYPQGGVRPSVPPQSQPYSQSSMSSSSFSSPATFPQMGGQAQSMVGVGTNSSQGMTFNPPGSLRPNSPNLMVNPRPGLTGNLHSGMPRALAGMVHAMTMAAAARAQGGGLMPTPGQGGQVVGNRFPPGGRWAAPRVIQPRMTQNQQRPRAEGQFNPGTYYN